MPTCCRAYSRPPSCCWHRTPTTLPRSPPAGSAPASATAGWAEAASARLRHRVRPRRARARPAAIRCARHGEAQFTARHDLLVTDEGALERLAVERGAGDVGMRLVEAGGDDAETPAVRQLQRR